MTTMPRRLRDTRDCAQEVIAAHVLGFDVETRDALIVEYTLQCQLDLALSIYGFIRLHYVEAIPGIAPSTGAWPFLWTLGHIVEGVAALSGASVEEVLYPILTGEMELESDLAPDELQQFTAIQTAVRGAQATLAAHFLVRRGRRPIGIQENLKLDDLHVVTRTLAILGEALLYAATERGVGTEDLVRVLLDPVAQILHELATELDRPLEAVVAEYWMQLCTQSPGEAG